LLGVALLTTACAGVDFSDFKTTPGGTKQAEKANKSTDPNAPADPNTPADPNAPADSNAPATNPNKPADSNAPADSSASTDQNASADSNAQADLNAPAGSNAPPPLPQFPPAEAEIGAVVRTFQEVETPEAPVALKYDRYRLTYTYFLVRQKIKLFAQPSEQAAAAGTLYRNQKLDYQNTVYVKTGPNSVAVWYQVSLTVNGKLLSGYIRKDDAERRYYQFGKAEAAIRLVDAEVKSGHAITYVNNYKNRNGRPPAYQGRSQDALGNERSQSAPGYPDWMKTDEFVYLSDGSLLRYLFENEEGMVKVATVPAGKTYYVPTRYIPEPSALKPLTRAIVVDRHHQNEMVYEKIDDVWTLVSYSLATTGTKNRYAQPTPLGYYFVIEKRPSFDYLADGTNEIEGYAPYVLRYNGSAYIHGVPMRYKISEDGHRIYQGIVDYSRSIGTIPLSHKCVRNYSSHAKFLYDWYAPGQTIVIVIE
jgi:hypothetical protein